MNPRKLWEFITSKFGLFLVFIAVLFTGLFIYGRRQGETKQTAKLATPSGKKVEVGQVRLPLGKDLENGLPQQVVAPRAPAAKEETGADGQLVPFRSPPPPPPPAPRPAAASAASAAAVKKPEEKVALAPARKLRYASLVTTYTAPVVPPPGPKAPPVRFMPFGTLLKCKLVNTVDSANIETPVIAVLLEDVWQNNERVVPANTLVHGTARAGRIRDRVNAAGPWRFVWQDGRELGFTGVALDREYDSEIDGYGITDGSAGMKGRLMATDDYQELKMLASAAMSGFARGTQERTQTAYGTTITGSVANGVREGVAEVFELYAQRTLKDIEQNGHYVRVAAGKEFYVYVVESVIPERAKIAGAVVEATHGRETRVDAPPPAASPTKG
jgi:hypothetical protein